VFQESQNRIKSMVLIHKKLYQSKDLARVDFAEYVRSLIADLFRSYKADYDLITLKTNIDDVFLGIDTAIPCGLIINELVSNSLKYAFPEGRQGEIRIDLHSEKEGKFTLIVSDSGVGFPKDLDFRNTESLGLQLACTLVDQLQGTIGLNRTGGTKFKIVFTEPKDKQGG
jgi:two-component sensor histidine kinase